jgi:hypothetical protein
MELFLSLKYKLAVLFKVVKITRSLNYFHIFEEILVKNGRMEVKTGFFSKI